MKRAAVGVIGGVGPAATAEFLMRVIGHTDAQRDQDHADLVVFQHSTIPDRTAFIVGESDEDPSPVLAADAVTLESLGVVAIVLPCNTASAFIETVRAAVTIPVVDIVDAAVEDAQARGWSRIGVLSTEGTRLAGAYVHAVEQRGLSIVHPSDASQALLNTLIYDQVKAGRPPQRELFDAVLAEVFSGGADGAILGCTELSVAAALWESQDRVIDSLDSLATRTVTLAGCRLAAPGVVPVPPAEPTAP